VGLPDIGDRIRLEDDGGEGQDHEGQDHEGHGDDDQDRPLIPPRSGALRIVVKVSMGRTWLISERLGLGTVAAKSTVR